MFVNSVESVSSVKTLYVVRGHFVDSVFKKISVRDVPRADPSDFLKYDLISVKLPDSKDPAAPPYKTISISVSAAVIYSFNDSPMLASQPHFSPKFLI